MALADELLFGKLTEGGKVMIGVKDNELDFAFEALKKKEKARA